MDLKDGLEVVSDVCGGLSGVALLIPTYRVTAARALIKRQRDKLAAADPQDQTGLRRRFDLLDQQLSTFEEIDARWLKWGMWLLLSSFLLKLLFHYISKFS